MQPQIVPNSSNEVEEGNTNSSSPSSKKKQISPAIRWCLTLNNWTNDEYDTIRSKVPENCRCGIIGREVGENGTPHLQGYIEFNVKSRPMNVFGIKRIHWEKAKGDKLQNLTYCSKEDKKPFTWKCKIKRKLKLINFNQLYEWQLDILKIIDNEPDGRTIHWYWSHKGCIGKTCFAKWLCVYKDAFCLNGRGHDVRNGILEYIEHEGDTPEFVLYPLPRCHGSDYVSYEALENILDMFFYSGKYKGGMVIGNSPHLIVFANEPPNKSKMSDDRWHIVCIDPENADNVYSDDDSIVSEL